MILRGTVEEDRSSRSGVLLYTNTKKKEKHTFL